MVVVGGGAGGVELVLAMQSAVDRLRARCAPIARRLVLVNGRHAFVTMHLNGAPSSQVQCECDGTGRRVCVVFTPRRAWRKPACWFGRPVERRSRRFYRRELARTQFSVVTRGQLLSTHNARVQATVRQACCAAAALSMGGFCPVDEASAAQHHSCNARLGVRRGRRWRRAA